MTLRQRFSKDPLKVVRQFDAFPKVPEEYQQSTRVGGTRKQNKQENNFNYKHFLIFSNLQSVDFSSVYYKPSHYNLSHLHGNYVLHG